MQGKFDQLHQSYIIKAYRPRRQLELNQTGREIQHRGNYNFPSNRSQKSLISVFYLNKVDHYEKNLEVTRHKLENCEKRLAERVPEGSMEMSRAREPQSGPSQRIRNQTEIGTQTASMFQAEWQISNKNPEVLSRAGRDHTNRPQDIPYQENWQQNFLENKSRQNQSSNYLQ